MRVRFGIKNTQYHACENKNGKTHNVMRVKLRRENIQYHASEARDRNTHNHASETRNRKHTLACESD